MNKKSVLVGVIIIVALVLLVIITNDSDTNAVDSAASIESVDEVASSVDRSLGQTINYYDGAEGYLAIPEGDGQYPALVMIHEWWGLNDHIRNMADEYAADGYVVLAVDLYSGQVADTPDMAGQLDGAVREDTETAFANLRAATDYLRSLDYVDSEQLAAIGWCFGGDWAYRMATNDFGLDASVMYYGRFSADDDLDMMRTALLGHFGEDDQLIDIDTVREFKASLESADDKHAVYIYPNAGHAFSNDTRSDSYDAAAAGVAKTRTLEFLEQNLAS